MDYQKENEKILITFFFLHSITSAIAQASGDSDSGEVWDIDVHRGDISANDLINIKFDFFVKERHLITNLESIVIRPCDIFEAITIFLEDFQTTNYPDLYSNNGGSIYFNWESPNQLTINVEKNVIQVTNLANISRPLHIRE